MCKIHRFSKWAIYGLFLVLLLKSRKICSANTCSCLGSRNLTAHCTYFVRAVKTGPGVNMESWLYAQVQRYVSLRSSTKNCVFSLYTSWKKWKRGKLFLRRLSVRIPLC